MDFNMKQWRDQQEDSQEEQQPSAKIPRQVLLESPQHHQPQETVPTTTALPLFVSQPNKINTHLSDFPHLSPISPTPTATFSKLGGGHCFSLAQWQELELQALIYRHMVAGTAIPHELLQLVKKSLLTSSTSPYYLPHYPPHFQSSAFLQGGYWGKGAMDPEPGRCRRTDGKKWRCSRDVVAGHKYCERHMNRGRNRSRKPVEISTSTGLNNNHNGGGSAVKSAVSGGSTRSAGGRAGGEIQFSFSDAGAQLNQVASKYETHSRDANAKSNKVLMHFFDDWPTSLQESSTNINVSVGAGTSVEANSDSLSTRSLTISTNGDPTSDFLRLSTGNGDDLGHMSDRQRVESGWTAQWGANPVGSMGGPLAEALRSSTNSSSSPTSVLHQLTRRSSSDTNFVNC